MIVRLLAAVLLAQPILVAVKIRTVNLCTRTISPKYYASTATSNGAYNGGFTLGPSAHTNLTLPDATDGYVWGDFGDSSQCQVKPSRVPPTDVAYVGYNADSYYVDYSSGHNVDMDICPDRLANGVSSGSGCICGSSCPYTTRSKDGVPQCPVNCHCEHECWLPDSAQEMAFVVTFCFPSAVVTDASATAATTSRRRIPASTKTSIPTSGSTATASKRTSTSTSTSTTTTLTTTTQRPHSFGRAERECPCNVGKLWMDVVIAVDISESMFQYEGMASAYGIMAGVFAGVTMGAEPVHYVRTGIVTFASSAKTVLSLTTPGGYEGFVSAFKSINLTQSADVNTLAGLNGAEQVLEHASRDASRPAIVILISSAYATGGYGDPAGLANHLKAKGRTIFTLAIVIDGINGADVSRIGALASDGFSFLSNGARIEQNMQQGLCRANCFCPSGWTQVADDFSEPTKKFGECVQLVQRTATWGEASASCAKLDDGSGFLASELSKTKHIFNADYVYRVEDTLQPYHIGLRFDAQSGRYVWQEKDGQGDRYALDPNGFQAWLNGVEDHARGHEVINTFDNDQAGNMSWVNVVDTTKVSQFLCQRRTCDTDNYCPDRGEALERPCDCDPGQLWLDVVVALDVSVGVTQEGLSDLTARIAYTLATVPVGQGLVHQTRVGIVIYSDKAAVYAPLTKFGDNYELLNGLSSTTLPEAGAYEVNILQGLRKSYEVYLAANSTKFRPTVFMIAASSYNSNQEDPKPFANKLKSEGHTIVTILADVTVNDEHNFVALGDIASEGYATKMNIGSGFNMRKNNVLAVSDEMLEAFCNANCICPTGWTRVEDPSISPPTPYGTCVQVSAIEADWATAAKECSSRAKGTGFLASERSRLKHAFISDYVKASKGAAVPYHIGLSKSETATEAAYYWQEKGGDGTHLKLQSSDFQPWAKGVSGGGSDVQVAPDGQAMMWFPVDRNTVKSYYVCETAACDSENYCDEATLSGL